LAGHVAEPDPAGGTDDIGGASEIGKGRCDHADVALDGDVAEGEAAVAASAAVGPHTDYKAAPGGGAVEDEAGRLSLIQWYWGHHER
jgi:hypothetical protein